MYYFRTLMSELANESVPLPWAENPRSSNTALVRGTSYRTHDDCYVQGVMAKAWRLRGCSPGIGPTLHSLYLIDRQPMWLHNLSSDMIAITKTGNFAHCGVKNTLQRCQRRWWVAYQYCIALVKSGQHECWHESLHCCLANNSTKLSKSAKVAKACWSRPGDAIVHCKFTIQPDTEISNDGRWLESHCLELSININQIQFLQIRTWVKPNHLSFIGV